MSDDFSYKAFISYSHRDAALASKLHRTLENYRVPKRIVGTEGRDGAVVGRLVPIFRDREELPTSSDLGQTIRDALEKSAYLIVLCSPYSASSRWVNEEIRYFKSLGRSNRVLCLILSGDPNASDSPENGGVECFPKALRYEVDQTGAITDERFEPIAADLRPGGDKWSDAILKLIAGLLGVGFDQLKQRHLRRKRVRMAQFAGCTLLAMLGLGFWWYAEQEAKADLARSSKLSRWVESGRQELLNGSSPRALAWLKAAYDGGRRDNMTRYLLAQALEPMDTPQVVVKDKDDPIRDAFFLPTENRLLTVHESGAAKLRQASDGSILALLDWNGPPTVFTGPSELAPHVLISFDGNEASCLNMKDGKKRTTFTGHSGTVTCASTSSSGRLAITGSEDRTARLWEIDTGMKRAVLTSHGGSVTGCLISPDERWAATCSTDGHVRIWEVESGKLLNDLGDFGSPVVQLIVSDDGRALAVLAMNGLVAGWETSQWQSIGRLAPTSNRPLLIFFGHPEAPLAAVTGNDETYNLKVINVSDGHTVAVFKGHTALVSRVMLTDNGEVMASQSMDRTVRLWDMKSAKSLIEFDADMSFSPFEGVGQRADLSKDGTHLLRLGANGELIIWHLARGIHMEGVAAEGGLSRAGFDASGTTMIGWKNTRAYLWKTDKSTLLHVWQNSDGVNIHSARLNSSGTHGVLVTGDSRVRFWDVETGIVGAPIEGVLSLDFLPKSKKCVLRMSDGSLAELDMQSQTEMKKIVLLTTAGNIPVMSSATIRISPDGALIAAAAGGEVQLVSMSTSRLVHTLATPSQEGVTGLAWNRDGSRLLVSRQTVAELWDPNGTLITTAFPGHEFMIQSATFNAGGGRFATAGGDGFAHVFDAESGRLVSSIKAGSSFVNLASLSPDGQFLVTSCNEGGVTVWDVATGRSLGGEPGLLAEFSPTGKYLMLMDRVLVLRPFRLENRTESSITDLLSDRIQWSLRDDQLVPMVTSQPREAETPSR